MKRNIFIFLVGIFIFFYLEAFAQINLDKYRDRIVAGSGEVVKRELVVENRSRENISIRAYLEDFVYLAPFDGRKEFRQAGTVQYSCSQWITVAPDIFTLGPSQKQTVVYTIAVPPNAKGGYSGVIFFEKKQSNSSGIGVVMREGCTLLLESTDAIKEVKLEELTAGKENIEGKFLNAGNIIMVSEPSYYIMDEKGAVFNKGSLKKFYLPMQESTPFSISLSDKTLPTGKYILFIDFGENFLAKEIELLKAVDNTITIEKVK